MKKTSCNTQTSYRLKTNLPQLSSYFALMIQPGGQVRAKSKASRKIMCCREIKFLFLQLYLFLQDKMPKLSFLNQYKSYEKSSERKKSPQYSLSE